MQLSLIDFWERFRSGIDVGVASSEPDKLLGVRDGFLRYFHDGLERPVAVAVAALSEPHGEPLLPLSDDEILAVAQRKVLELARQFGDAYPFYVSCETGLHTIEIGEEARYFVRSWCVIQGVVGEACGGSGSLQLPAALIDGMDSARVPYAVPGTRRRGGMVSSLTGGLETRRRAISLATLHAVSTLLFGILESRPMRRPQR